MPPTDFLTIKDFTPDEIQQFLDLALKVKADPGAFAGALRGQSLALIFEKPSLRTRVSFDVGIQQLGGFSVYLSPSEINLGRRESVHDVAKNLERLVQGIMIRTFAHEIVEQLAAHASIPVINGLTDASHPCQAMADVLTVLEIKGRVAGQRIVYVGDGNNVAHSLMYAGAQLGAQVVVATPPGYEPRADAIAWTRQRAAETGGALEITNDPGRSSEWRRRRLYRRVGEHGPGDRSDRTQEGVPALSGQRHVVRAGEAGRAVPALPARTPGRGGHR
jgi:ornithine carbamoyltransferase